MSDPARFNRRLALEAPVETDDGAGGVTRSYEQVVVIQLGCVAVMQALAELDPAIAASLSFSEPAPPPDVIAQARRPTRNARNGGAVVAAGGAIGETTQQAGQADKSSTLATAASPMTHMVMFGVLGVGIGILLVAIVIERRRLAVLARKWCRVDRV